MLYNNCHTHIYFSKNKFPQPFHDINNIGIWGNFNEKISKLFMEAYLIQGCMHVGWSLTSSLCPNVQY